MVRGLGIRPAGHSPTGKREPALSAFAEGKITTPFALGSGGPPLHHASREETA